MLSEREQFAQAQFALNQQLAIQAAARETLGGNVSLNRLSSGLLEASLRTLEEAGLGEQIPSILRAAADNYERAKRDEGAGS